MVVGLTEKRYILNIETIFILYINGVSRWIWPRLLDLKFLSNHEWCNGIVFRHLDAHEHSFFLPQDHVRGYIITMHISRKSIGSLHLLGTSRYLQHIHVRCMRQLDLRGLLRCHHHFLLNFHYLIHHHLILNHHHHHLHFRHLHFHHFKVHLLQLNYLHLISVF